MTGILSLRKPRPEPGAELSRVPRPAIGPTDVRVRIRAASVCGTDKHIFNWDAWAQGRIKPPMTFGHEACGDVVEVGALVKNVAVDDFVSLETHVPCGTCFQCRTGAQHICRNLKILGVDTAGCFAEEIVVPEVCAWKNPKDMDPRIAAIQEPFGNAVYCVDKAKVGARRVAIMGDGPIASFAAGICRAMGASEIVLTGLSATRLEIARRMGATSVVDSSRPEAEEQMKSLAGDGFDVVLEMAGAAATVRQGFQVLRKGGTFVAFGIPAGDVTLDYANALVFKEATVLGINGRLMFETWFQTRAILEKGLVDPLPVVTHEMALEDFAKAFDVLNDPAGTAGKIVLRPGRA
jgi:threonine 3-dehydrogenase